MQHATGLLFAHCLLHSLNESWDWVAHCGFGLHVFPLRAFPLVPLRAFPLVPLRAFIQSVYIVWYDIIGCHRKTTVRRPL